MSVPADMTYPKAAQKATWDKGKTLADKMSKKTKTTGLGPALKAAEDAWGKIPFESLVPATAKIKSANDAQTAKGVADKAIKKQVAAAYVAIRKAQVIAVNQSLNQDLSTASRGVAKAANLALKGLISREGSFDTDDFDALIENYQEEDRKEYAKTAGQLTELVVKLKGKQVATGTKGVWNKRELKADGLVWSVGRGTDYIDQLVTVEARQASDDHKEDKHSGHFNDPKAKFINDLKVESVSGKKAVLKP